MATTATASYPAPDLIEGDEPAPASAPRIRSRPAAALVAIVAGLLIALSMPPYGWWPLVFVGIALWDRLIEGAPWRRRLARSYLLALAWYVPTITWSYGLTAPGYVLAVTGMSVYQAVAGALTPPGRWRRLAMPGTVVIAQYLQGISPWGGIPVAHLALTQAGSCAGSCTQIDSPLVNIARIGGPPLLIAAVVVAGQALAAAADGLAPRLRRPAGPALAARRRSRRAALIGLGVVVALTVAGTVAPRGRDVAPLRVAVVQGGGPQTTPPGNSDAPLVFQRHLDATRSLVRTPVDVVVWPENVVVLGTAFGGSEYERILQDLARQLQATLIVGVTEEPVALGGFLNASVVIHPDGTTGERYDKVHIVPFGEYVPHRALVEAIVGEGGNGIPSTDAVPGTGTGLLRSRAGDFGVMISFEDFFFDRSRSATAAGGEVLLNPTNGASYWLTQVQAQQIASSRLRAVETGRWHLQSAPTGFSSVITPDGVLLQRTDVSEQAVLHATVQRRAGDTIWMATGELPWLAGAASAILAGWALSRRRNPANV